MPAIGLLRAAAAALILAAASTGAVADHRAGRAAPAHAPAMHRMHGDHHRMHHQGMHRHGMRHHGMHRRHHAMHHGGGYRGYVGHRAVYAERAFFPRPRYHRRHAYGWRQSYAPAYYPYRRGVSHGYGFRSYSYPVASYGVVSGGSVYAPLYNRPAYSCY